MNRIDLAPPRSRRPQLDRLLRQAGWLLRVLCGVACSAMLAISILAIANSGGSAATGPAAIGTDYALLAGLLAVLALIVSPGRLAAGVRQKLGLLAMGTFVAAAIFEGYIRLFDPFPILLRGGRISLPVNSEKHFSSNGLPGLDAAVSVRFNSLGFRGPEPPADWKDRFTIICVGGSTTQCLYLSDGTTWPDRLADKLAHSMDRVWLNNAGSDGHSTFGHAALLDQYLAALHPRLILFCVGLNDVDRHDLNQSDRTTLRTQIGADDSPARALQRRLLRSSDAFALMDSFRMQWLAQRRGLTHGEPIAHRGLTGNTEAQPLTPEARNSWLEARDPSCIAGYESRLTNLVLRCQALDIDCVLITQPVLYGVGVDDLTGLDLAAVRVGEVDGATHWQLLQQYNQVTVKVGAACGAPVIDLANQMPKSTRYFYDLTHCNLAGAEKIASIIHAELLP